MTLLAVTPVAYGYAVAVSSMANGREINEARTICSSMF
jgi:hypothetical protein